MLRPHGITITLWNKTQTGTDPLGAPIYAEIPEPVDDVIVAPASSQEILDATNLYGKKAVYTLGIPKGDTHEWRDKEVTFFGQDWKTFGIPTEGIEDLIPLRWNKKIMVARYE